MPSWVVPVQARPRRRVRLIDERFERASDFVVDALAFRGRRWRLIGYVLGHPGGLIALIRVVSRLPWLSIALSDDEYGATIRETLASPRDGSRQIAMAVLDIPESADLYLVGRPKQALRTNVRRAERAGIRCVEVSSERDRRRHFGEMLRRDDAAEFGPGWLDEGATSTVVRCYVAMSADGRTLAVAAVVIDREWAVLTCFLRHPDREEAADARYLLQDHLVEVLSREGVRHLTVDSALRVSKGLRYFQHLVGFRPVNLHVAKGRVPSDQGAPA